MAPLTRRSRSIGAAALAVGLAAAITAVFRHRRLGRHTGAGILITDVSAYDRQAGWLLGGFYEGIARDVASEAGVGASVLDVGCGPGHLAARLVEHGLVVTAADLDPAMVERAGERLGDRAAVAMADVAALPFEDGAFDVVVSTLSMHHWTDVPGGLAEIARVLAPGGRALVWDLHGRRVPFHGHAHDPAERVQGTSLEVVSSTDWRWPWRISLVRRLELHPRP